jgi:hypothetical protein
MSHFLLFTNVYNDVFLVYHFVYSEYGLVVTEVNPVKQESDPQNASVSTELPHPQEEPSACHLLPQLVGVEWSPLAFSEDRATGRNYEKSRT